MAERVSNSDLTGYARIRNAALASFAREGVKATSVRDVARAAGVSPGLVQHHFPTKAALRDAVNAHVIASLADAFADLPVPAAEADPFVELGHRITTLVGESPEVLDYAARSIVEGDESALRLFDGFVAVSSAQWEQLAGEGRLREDLDLRWAALHSVVFNLGTVLFRRALERHLDAPFFTPAELERWNVATTAMMERGSRKRSSSRGRVSPRGRPRRAA
jgi:TetR/AcrR family transcriptional regulator, regulator of cefoperazone and chloramphenicol sensitivity